ncbi:hypothetical protein [Rubritalea squalenifaciens]|nr:hypothetical protein [Rubritalea squalenifaciens]
MKLADKIDNGGSILTQDLSEALQLGKDRIQLEVKESATVTKMKIGGKVLPEQKKQGELLKIKLLGVRKDGKWDFKPANASLQLSPKQQQQLGNVSFGFVLNDCYSEVPRSVGETWDDGHGYLKLLTGVDQGLQGENKVTFDEVVDYQGQQCAVLTRKFHVTVRLDQGYSMKMTGEETTIRSLSQFFDL